MKVICLASELTRDQKRMYGISDENNFRYPFEVRKIYTVLGLNNDLSQGGCMTLEMPYFYSLTTPLCLFDIVDNRPSGYWKIKKMSEYEIALWPEEFYQKYFHDFLSDGVPEVVKIYEEVLERLEKEFD